jgi:hypothetical protein
MNEELAYTVYQIDLIGLVSGTYGERQRIYKRGGGKVKLP